MTITTNNNKQYITTINETEIVKYLITNTSFIEDKLFTKQYRTTSQNSTVGSPPIIFNNVNRLSFVNNTECNPKNGIKIFNYSLNGTGNVTSQYAFTDTSPGYLFWMVASDNIINNFVISYDPITKQISCHKLHTNGNFEFVWEKKNITISACIAIVACKNHIYVNDYVNGFDHFVVLNLLNGNEIARIKTEATLPTMGNIVPGMNNDVYLFSSQLDTTSKNGYITRITI
jgi:hypothetical protein